MIEHLPRTEEIKLPEILEASRVAEIAQAVFESTSFEVGRQFVESNVVLTMSGLKPTTEISVLLEDEMDLPKFSAELDRISDLLETAGVNIMQAIGPLTHAFEQKPVAMSGITNLRGVERTAKLSRFKGMPDFKSSGGIEGYERWLSKVWQWLQAAQDSGSIPKDYNLQYINEGIRLGYPDQAIWDFAGALAKGDKSRLIHSHLAIPDMRKHHGALPSYAYYPEHAQDPNIVDNIAMTKRILMEFYASPGYQAIMADPRWKAA